MANNIPSSLIINVMVFSVLVISLSGMVFEYGDAYSTSVTNFTSIEQLNNMTMQLEDIQNTTQSSNIESGNVLDLSLSVVRGVYEAILLTFRIPTLIGSIASDAVGYAHLGNAGAWIVLLISGIVMTIISFAIISAVMKWRM